jgi:hypothetical protein
MVGILGFHFDWSCCSSAKEKMYRREFVEGTNERTNFNRFLERLETEEK